MKASALLKVWAYAELGFVAYLLLREKPITDGLPPEQKQALDDLSARIKETVNAKAQIP